MLSGSLLAEALDASETGVDVDDGTDFSIGDVIKVDDEQMDVTNIAANTLTVTRGVNGTTAATHVDNTPVYVRPFEKITVSSTAVGFTATRIPDGVVTTRCHLEDADIRFRRGGAAPTATIGQRIYAGTTFEVKGAVDIKAIQFIRVSADATLWVEHEVEA